MEGQKKSNWADESEEEWSDQERPAPEQKSLVTAQNSRRDNLISAVKTQSFPLTIFLANLSYRITERDLRSELQLSDQAEIVLEQGERGPNGMATVKVNTAADAMKVAERHDTEVCGRLLTASLNKHGSYHKGNVRGGGRGQVRGGRGGRGGRKNYDDYKGYEKSYEKSYEKNYEKSYEKSYEKKNYNQNRTYEREEERPEKHFERKFENKNKSEKQPTKITIAPSEETHRPTTQPSQVFKSKSNPFGEAKPVDTLRQELEFEKKLESEKKPGEGEETTPQHEKRYVKKENKDSETRETEKTEPKPHVEKTEHQQETPKPVEIREIRENKEEKQDLKDPKDSQVTEPALKPERQDVEKPHEGEDYYRPHSGRGGRGNRRGYRKKPDNRPDTRRREADDERHAEGREAREARDDWGAENPPVESQDNRRRGYDGYRRGGYDDRRRGDRAERGDRGERSDRGRGYNDRRQHRNYEDKKLEEDPGYIKHFENRNKEPRPAAWGNPEQAAEILKKPKEAKPIQEEEKQTKKGTNYVKKSYKEEISK